MGETDVGRQLVLVLSLKFLQSFGYAALARNSVLLSKEAVYIQSFFFPFTY